jgi:uncharacterized protein (TIGR01777 family)
MKVVVTGATGLIGKNLCRELLSRGDKVSLFTRSIPKAKLQVPGAHFIKWDYRKPDEWKNEVEGKDAVIHLAGANINNKRWTDEYKKIILASRVISTKSLVHAMEQAVNKPKVFVCASGSGFYGEKGEELLTEENSAGNDFMAEVCKAWEAEASKAENSGIRRISLRQSPALDPGSGALKEFLLPFKLFVGGPLGSGKQWFPWIHIKDLIDVYLFVMDNENINGPVNASSPVPVRMNEFAKTLGMLLHRPSFFKIPKKIIKLVIGEVVDSVTLSARVIPKKLMESGFEFRFKELEYALKDLLRKT